MAEQSKRKDSVAVVVIGIITLIFALGAAVFLLVTPAAATLLASLKNVRLSGIMASPWVGLRNFQQVIQMPFFSEALFWSVMHSIVTATAIFLFSLLTGYLLLALRRAKWLRYALCTLLLIPLIVPNDLWALLYFRLNLFIPKGGNGLNGMIIAYWCSLKYMGLPALLVSAAVSRGKTAWSVPPLAGGAVSLALLAVLGRFDFGFMRYLPSPLSAVAGINTLDLRMTFMNMQIGAGAALEVMRMIMTGVVLAAVAAPVAIMIKRLFPAGLKPDDVSIKDRLTALAIPGGIVAVAAIALAIAALAAGIKPNELKLYANYPVYIVLAFAAAAVNTVLCYLLARPAACSAAKAGRVSMTAVLLLLTAASCTAVSIGEYLLLRSVKAAGMFGVALSGIGCVWGVWPLLFAAKAMGVETGTDWFKRMWKPSLALFGAQAMLQINNTLPAYIYISKIDSMHPLGRVMAAVQSMPIAALGARGGLSYPLMLLATMALPVILLLILRTVFNEKENLGLFLPGR